MSTASPLLRAPLAAALAAALAACGEAELIAREPLAIADTSPGSGALVPAGDTRIVVLFSAPVDARSLPEALTLDRTTAAGEPLATIDTALAGYAAETFAATWEAGALEPGAYFRLRLDKAVVRGEDGSTLGADFTRAFRTALE